MIRLAPALLLAACAGETTITGVVDAHLRAAAGAAGVTVELRDAAFERVDQTTTDDRGVFTVVAPRGEEIHLVVRGEGLVPIAFPGESGLQPEFVVPPGQLWAFRPEDEDAWRATFAGCPGAADGDGMVVGTLWPAVNVDDPTVGPPERYGFAFVASADDPEGSRQDACYLETDCDADEDPTCVHDPGAVRTGETGRFAIFGVEGGPWALTLGRYTGDPLSGGQGTLLGRRTVYVPEGGVVHQHPGLVPF